MKKSQSHPEVFLRCFHALAQDLSIDIYVDNLIYSKDLLYEDFDDYFTLAPGSHEVYITKHGDEEILSTRSIWLSKEKIYTLIIASHPKTSTPGIYLIEDERRPIPEEQCLLRIAHFSELPEPVTVSLSDHKRFFKKVTLHQVSYYLAYPTGTYTLTGSFYDSQEVICTLENILLKPSRIYTLYVLGSHCPEYPDQFILSIDGSSFLSF